MADLVLGIDVGSSRIKALLVDRQGHDVASAAVPTPFVTEAGGTRAEATVGWLLHALGEVLAPLGGERERVAGVGIAGIGESGAPLDRSGAALAPILAWHDLRGEDVADRLSERFGDELGERIGQRLRSVSSVAKLGWLTDNGVSRVARWLGVPELGLHALTGAHATEHSLAARTGCWDVGRRGWLDDVAAAAGFGIEVFPEVVTAGVVMGRVTPEAAARFGIPVGAPVTIAGHDHLAGLIGSGADPRDLGNSVGTAETVIGRSSTLPHLRRALERELAVTVFPGGDGWAVMSSAARSGLALSSAAVALGRSEAELDQLSVGASLLEAPGLRDSLQRRDPPLLPEGAPGDAWHTLLDELASLTAAAVVRVVGLVGPRRRLVVFGGGAASLPWLEAKAQLVPLPVWRVRSAEAVARGAAIYGGVAAGWWPSPAAAPPPPLEPL